MALSGRHAERARQWSRKHKRVDSDKPPRRRPVVCRPFRGTDAPQAGRHDGLVYLPARALVVHLTRNGWAVTEIAERLGADRRLLDVVVATGAAPSGLAHSLAELLYEPIPNVSVPVRAADCFSVRPEVNLWAANFAVSPAVLMAVWSAECLRAEGSCLRLSPPHGWSSLRGRLSACRRHGNPASAHDVVFLRLDKGSNVQRWKEAAQDLEAQQYVEWTLDMQQIHSLPELPESAVICGEA